MTQLWRHTGNLVDGAQRTVTFTFSKPIAIPDDPDEEFATTIRGLAALGVMRGLVTDYCNTQLVELSEDDGQTWRAVWDSGYLARP